MNFTHKQQRIIDRVQQHCDRVGRTVEVTEFHGKPEIWIGSGERYSQSHCLHVFIGPRGGTTKLLDGKKSKTSLGILLDVYIR